MCLFQIAVPLIVQIASAQHPTPIPIFVAEVIYLRATFTASGVYPDHVQHDPRVAFRDFDQAARAGYAQAWFRLDRDYENFNDGMHARVCFECGVELNVENSVYVCHFRFYPSTFSNAYVIAYGHGILDGPTQSSSAARDRSSLVRQRLIPYRSLSPRTYTVYYFSANSPT